MSEEEAGRRREGKIEVSVDLSEIAEILRRRMAEAEIARLLDSIKTSNERIERVFGGLEGIFTGGFEKLLNQVQRLGITIEKLGRGMHVKPEIIIEMVGERAPRIQDITDKLGTSLGNIEKTLSGNMVGIYNAIERMNMKIREIKTPTPTPKVEIIREEVREPERMDETIKEAAKTILVNTPKIAELLGGISIGLDRIKIPMPDVRVIEVGYRAGNENLRETLGRADIVYSGLTGAPFTTDLMWAPIQMGDLSQSFRGLGLEALKLALLKRQLAMGVKSNIKAMEEQNKVVQKLTKVGSTGSMVVSKVSETVMEMGSAIAYSLPIIGQFIAVLSITYGAVKSVASLYKSLGTEVKYLSGVMKAAYQRIRDFSGRIVKWYLDFEKKILSIPVVGKIYEHVRTRITTLLERSWRTLKSGWDEGKGLIFKIMGILKTIITIISLRAIGGIKGIGSVISSVVGGLAGGKLAGMLGAGLKAVTTGLLGKALLAVGIAMAPGKIAEALGVTAETFMNEAKRLEEAGHNISASIMKTAGDIWNFGDTAKQWLSENIPVIGGALGEVAQGIIHTGALVVGGIGKLTDIGETIWSKLTSGFEYVKSQLAGAWEGFKNWVTENVWNKITAAWDGFATWVRENVWSKITSAWDGFSNWVKENVWNKIASAWDGFSDWIRENVWSKITGAFDALVKGAGSVFQRVAEPISGAIKTVSEGARTVMSNIQSSLQSFGSSLMNLGGKIFSSLTASVDLLKKAIGGNPTGLVGAVSRAGEAMKEFEITTKQQLGTILPSERGRDYTLDNYFASMISILMAIRSEIAGLRGDVKMKPPVEIKVESGRVIRYG